VEVAAFSPPNVVRGIGSSPDKMLQPRIFSYADAHRYRLGTHDEALPINTPKCAVNHYHKDGQTRFFANFPEPDAYDEPSSFQGPVQDPDPDPDFAEPPLKLSGDAARYDHREGNDDDNQPRALCNLFDDGRRARLFSSIAEAMKDVPDPIMERQLKLFDKVDPAYGEGVREALKRLYG